MRNQVNGTLELWGKAFKPYDLKINKTKTEYTKSKFSVSKSRKDFLVKTKTGSVLSARV